MQPKSYLYLKVLMNRFNPGTGEAYLKPLPKKEAKEILSQNVASQDAAAILRWAKEEIQHTHYSWFIPSLEAYPREMQQFILEALPKAQAQRLAELLKLPLSDSTLAAPIKTFLLDMFWKKWKEKPTLPKAFLPPSPLLSLTAYSKTELTELINFLSLYDLAESTRKIVDKKHIKTILQYLSPIRQQFLRICYQQKEKIVAPKLDIEHWDGNPKKLDLLLHRRGMLRLGKALAGQHPDFVWHLVHILDSGRGTIVAKHYIREEVPGVTSLLIQQVLFVMNFLKKKSHVRE